MPAVQQLAHVIAFGSAFAFLAQATSETGCAVGGNSYELTLLQLRANHTKEAQAETVAAGSCTRTDEAEMRKFGGGSLAGSFPTVLADCGRKAYSWFRWHRSKMEKCIRKTVKISGPCTKCFSEAGQYGYQKCKGQCLFGKWCSERCLGCTAEHDARTEACVGVDVPKPDFC